MRLTPSSTWPPRFPNQSNNEILLAEVLRNGGIPNIHNGQGSMFHVALARDNERILDYIIDNIPDFDYTIEDRHGENVFQKLTDPQNVGIAIKLLNKLRDQSKAGSGRASRTDLDLTKIFKRLKNKNTVLHECVIKSNSTLLNYLLANADTFGIDPQALGAAGETYEGLKVS